IQALLDEGANKVVLFTVAKTAHHSDSKQGVQYDFDAFGNPINSSKTARYNDRSRSSRLDAFGNPVNTSDDDIPF
ncbi:hypothetical protein KZ355_05400, partial [Glaesserella parasuis]|nr:hypothetical protein [Glaesserella parasuis]